MYASIIFLAALSKKNPIFRFFSCTLVWMSISIIPNNIFENFQDMTKTSQILKMA